MRPLGSAPLQGAWVAAGRSAAGWQGTQDCLDGRAWPFPPHDGEQVACQERRGLAKALLGGQFGAAPYHCSAGAGTRDGRRQRDRQQVRHLDHLDSKAGISFQGYHFLYQTIHQDGPWIAIPPLTGLAADGILHVRRHLVERQFPLLAQASRLAPFSSRAGAGAVSFSCRSPLPLPG